jgi:uncharacterized caspase-like protein
MKRHFLAIGVGRFHDAEPLPAAVPDAEAMLAHMAAHGECDARILRDPDRRAILEGLETLAQSCLTNEDELVVYVASHASIVEGEWTLWTSETSRATPFHGSVTARDIVLALRGAPPRGLLILDTCHAEAALLEGGVQRGSRRPGPPELGLSLMTASAAAEASVEVGQQGVYTKVLLEVLRGGIPGRGGWIHPADATEQVALRLAATRGSPTPGFRAVGTSIRASVPSLARNPAANEPPVPRPAAPSLRSLAEAAACIEKVRALAGELARGSTVLPPPLSRTTGELAPFLRYAPTLESEVLVLEHLGRVTRVKRRGARFISGLGVGLALLGVVLFLVRGEIAWLALGILMWFSDLFEDVKREDGDGVLLVSRWGLVCRTSQAERFGLWKDLAIVLRENEAGDWRELSITWPDGVRSTHTAGDAYGGPPRLMARALSWGQRYEVDHWQWRLFDADARDVYSGSESVVSLVVAVSDYDKVNKLVAARNDAGEMAKVLGGAGEPVVDPTNAQLRARLLLACEAARGRVLALYFSGHGVTIGGDHFLCPKDWDPARPSSTGFRTRDVVTYAIESGVRHVVLIVNACFAGGAIAKGESLRELFEPLWNNRGSRFSILASSAPSELSFGIRGQSLFMGALVDAIGDGKRRLLDLEQDVPSRLTERAARAGVNQTSWSLISEISGEIELAPSPDSAAARSNVSSWKDRVKEEERRLLSELEAGTGRGIHRDRAKSVKKIARDGAVVCLVCCAGVGLLAATSDVPLGLTMYGLGAVPVLFFGWIMSVVARDLDARAPRRVFIGESGVAVEWTGGRRELIVPARQPRLSVRREYVPPTSRTSGFTRVTTWIDLLGDDLDRRDFEVLPDLQEGGYDEFLRSVVTALEGLRWMRRLSRAVGPHDSSTTGAPSSDSSQRP